MPDALAAAALVGLARFGLANLDPQIGGLVCRVLLSVRRRGMRGRVRAQWGLGAELVGPNLGPSCPSFIANA